MLVKLLSSLFLFCNPLIYFLGGNFNLTKNQVEISIHDIKGAAISAAKWATPDFLPIRDLGIEDPSIDAAAAYIIGLKIDGDSLKSEIKEEEILYQENEDKILPIASLTKIMTAIIVLDHLDLNQEVTISQEAIDAYGDRGGLILDEIISVDNLLHALLMESSNDAAFALAQATREKTGIDFIELMEKKSAEMNLSKTHFSDPSGYNCDNVSTVKEISEIVKNSFAYPKIWQILEISTIDLYSVDGKIHHHWINTDKLINHSPEVIGGKTGYTEEAKGCLVLVTRHPSRYLLSVVLGTDQRFLETEKLIEWVNKAYKW